jgi:hypothetical protein
MQFGNIALHCIHYTCFHVLPLRHDTTNAMTVTREMRVQFYSLHMSFDGNIYKYMGKKAILLEAFTGLGAPGG